MSGSKKWLRTIAMFILVTFCATVLPAYASKLQTMKNKQQEIREQMEDKKQEIQEKKEQYNDTLGRLKDLEQNMQNVRGDLDTLKHKLNITEDELSKAEAKLKDEQQKLDERTQIFRNRMVEVYVNGQVSYLDVLFSATDMHDFLVRMDLLAKLVEQDIGLMNEIDKKVADIEAEKEDILSKKEHIASIKDQTESKEKVLSKQTDEKKVLLATIEEEKKKAENALNELEKESNQIAAQIRKIQAASRRVRHPRRSNGRFMYPVPGHYTITSPYGWRIHPILKTRRMHTGVDFGAPMGAEMVAADDGTVIYTGWYGAYGNVVIIDHGSGISTMYCHMSKIRVSENQTVKAGQQVGDVGSTGWSTGPHAHFEVRVNGETVDPMQYLQ